MTDRIEKTIELTAPRSRVWQALTHAEEFSEWFKMKCDVVFAPGVHFVGKVTYPGYEHLRSKMSIERMEPEHLFSMRWHPNATDPEKDYSSEPTTLIEFKLDEIPGGTRLSIVESGFDSIPLSRREEAFRGNSQGWSEQLKNIERYVAQK